MAKKKATQKSTKKVIKKAKAITDQTQSKELSTTPSTTIADEQITQTHIEIPFPSNKDTIWVDRLYVAAKAGEPVLFMNFQTNVPVGTPPKQYSQEAAKLITTVETAKSFANLILETIEKHEKRKK